MGLRWVVVVMCDDEEDARQFASTLDDEYFRTTRVQQEAD